MNAIQKLDEVIRLTVAISRCAEPTTVDYAELTERRNALVHELRAALATVEGEPAQAVPSDNSYGVSGRADGQISIADESTRAEGDDKKVTSPRVTLNAQPRETPNPGISAGHPTTTAQAVPCPYTAMENQLCNKCGKFHEQAVPAGQPQQDTYIVDGVAWQGFVRDYARYQDGDPKFPFSELRASLAAVIESAHPPAGTAAAPTDALAALQELVESHRALFLAKPEPTPDDILIERKHRYDTAWANARALLAIQSSKVGESQ